MEFKKLFETQKILMDRIEKEHPVVQGEERSSKRLLALLVEIGECANEQRSWKFWSKDQEPRLKEKCKMCEGAGWFSDYDECFECAGKGVLSEKNPLLEELVDGLHFVLEEGLEFFAFESIDYDYLEGLEYPDVFVKNIAGYFLDFYRASIDFFDCPTWSYYKTLIKEFVYLASALGFTWEEVTAAYFEKNKVNHERQNNNY